jgi:flagellar assembly protein FliH
MSIVRKTGGLVKSGLKKAGHGSVVIGGMNAEEMSSKKDLIQDLINEAKVRAESEINDIKEQAQIEANQILEQAKAEVEAIENQAYLKGYEAGKQEAITKTEEELSIIILEANNIVASIKKEKEETLQDEEARVYQTILLIAKQLLKRDLEFNKDVSIEFISQAIKKLDHKVNINILCNNEIAGRINEIKSKLLEANPGLENLSITGDLKLEPGDIILESNKERLDFRLETLLEELAKEIIQ